MRKSFVILLAALFLLCTGCGKSEEHTLQIFAMDTVMDFYAVGEGAQETLNAAAQEINRLESLLSRTRQGSEVDALNRHGSVVLSDETAALLRQALQQLHPRERQIVVMRYGLEGHKELTQKEVAQIMGISQSYISRLEKRIMLRLRKELIKQTSCA